MFNVESKIRNNNNEKRTSVKIRQMILYFNANVVMYGDRLLRWIIVCTFRVMYYTIDHMNNTITTVWRRHAFKKKPRSRNWNFVLADT